MIIDWDCCDAPNLDPSQKDLGSKGGLEFVMFHCGNCDAYWMYVFSAATNMGSWERISQDEVARMLNLPNKGRIKKFLFNWFWNEK